MPTQPYCGRYNSQKTVYPRTVFTDWSFRWKNIVFCLWYELNNLCKV